MKKLSKILIFALSLVLVFALGTVIASAAEGESTVAEGTVYTIDGVEYNDASTFAANLSAITTTANVKLYADIESEQVNVKAVDGLYIDLAGHTITSTVGNNGLFRFDNANSALNLYSSVAGARIIGKNTSLSDGYLYFINNGVNGCTLNIGDYGEYSGDNLLIEFPTLGQIRGNTTINFSADFKFTTYNTGNANAVIVFVNDGCGTVNVEGSTIVLGVDLTWSNFTKSDTGTKPKFVNFNNCNIVTTNANHDLATNFDSDTSISFTNCNFYGANAFRFRGNGAAHSTEQGGAIVIGAGNKFQVAPTVDLDLTSLGGIEITYALDAVSAYLALPEIKNGDTVLASATKSSVVYMAAADIEPLAAYSITTNGVTTYYGDAGTDGADFTANVYALTSDSTVVLYKDITIAKATQASAISVKANVNFDLNGKTLTGNMSNGFIFNAGAAGVTLNVYSSVPGAKVVSGYNYVEGTANSNRYATLYMSGVENATFNIGAYGEYAGSNVTVITRVVTDIRALANNKVNIDGIYVDQINLPAGGAISGSAMLQVREALNLELNVRNCKIRARAGEALIYNNNRTTDFTNNNPKTVNIENNEIMLSGNLYLCDVYDTDMTINVNGNTFYASKMYFEGKSAAIQSANATGKVVIGEGNNFRVAPSVTGTNINETTTRLVYADGVVLAIDNNSALPAFNDIDGTELVKSGLRQSTTVKESATYKVHYNDGVNNNLYTVVVPGGNYQTLYSGTLNSGNSADYEYDFGSFSGTIKFRASSNTKPVWQYFTANGSVSTSEAAPKTAVTEQTVLEVYPILNQITAIDGLIYNLSLFNDLNLNVYVPVVDGLSVDADVCDGTVEINGAQYKAVVFERISTEIDVNVNIPLKMVVNGQEYAYTATTSVTQYLNQLISSIDGENAEFDKAKPLAKVLAVYAYEVLQNSKINTAGTVASELLTTLYNNNVASVNGGNYTVADAIEYAGADVLTSNVVTGLTASVELGVTPKWHFVGADGMTVSYVTYDNSEVTANIVNGYIDENGKLYNFNATLTFGENGVYNYATYLANADLADYDKVAGALYFLAETAKTYKNPAYAGPHECESACECGKCLDAECTENACAKKCEGHINVTFVVPNAVASVEMGENNTLPAAENFDKYTFAGWSTEANYTATTDAPALYLAGATYDGEAETLYAVYTYNETIPGEKTFNKVTTARDDWSGTYLIVYEGDNVAFNGALEKLDAASNTVDKNKATLANAFVITAVDDGYTIQSASGYYIGQTSDANGLASSDSETYVNTIKISTDGTVNIVSGGAYLRFNFASNQNRFRYYKSGSYTGQKAIVLYALTQSEGTNATYYVTICDHVNVTTDTVDATCEKAGSKTTVCDNCKMTISSEVIDALGHSYDDGVIDPAPTCVAVGVKTYRCGTCNGTKIEEIKATGHDAAYEAGNACGDCGEVKPVGGVEKVLANFTFGANGSASHYDGSSKTTYTETVNGYTLTLKNVSNFYTGARDAKGNSCIKLGASTSSKTGGFSFTVGANVTKVVIHIAQYKANTTKITVNGTDYTVTTASNNGEYTAIEIDTTTTKTITLTTVSSSQRAMVNGIDFIGIG